MRTYGESLSPATSSHPNCISSPSHKASASGMLTFLTHSTAPRAEDTALAAPLCVPQARILWRRPPRRRPCQL
eukprot:354318-Chlamydomonas_euryale.AAC.24